MRVNPRPNSDLVALARNIDLVKRIRISTNGLIGLKERGEFAPNLSEHLLHPHYVLFRLNATDRVILRSSDYKHASCGLKNSEWNLVVLGKNGLFHSTLIDVSKYWAYNVRENELLVEVPPVNTLVPYLYIPLSFHDRDIFY